MSATLTSKKFTYRHLVDEVDPELWDRLVNRVVREEKVELDRAERIIDAAIGFVKMCIDFPKERFAPTELVDIGWHTFILYTKGYHAFCLHYGDFYVHHEPSDGHLERYAPSGENTLEFMKRIGIPYDPEMWEGHWPCRHCSDCSRCRNDPPPN